MKALANYREKFFEEWYQFNDAVFFIIVCLLYFTILLLKRLLIISDIAAFEVLQERGEMWVFDLFFGLQYLSIPFFLAWKFTMTTFLIWVGCFMFGYKVTFAAMWKWVMFTELIFVVPEFLKLLWFLIAGGDPGYQDVVAFYPLSLMNFVDHTAVDPRFHYPLKALNVFEAFYWFGLVVGVFYLSKKKWIISVYAVFTSYVLFFFLWLVFYVLVYK